MWDRRRHNRTMHAKNLEVWPSLPLEEWEPTRATLHMWTQVVGKIRMALSPATNHWWHVPLYVTPKGLSTHAIPYHTFTFAIDFDFHHHHLDITTSRGEVRQLALRPRSVAAFHAEVMALLRELEIDVHIWPMPVEVADPIRFDEDETHASYDPEYVRRFWRILEQSTRVMTEFRARFLGKVSPVHFFWGSFDLAVTRFSGRVAPPHPGAPGLPLSIVREAYSHEVSSAGWWPGGSGIDGPMYYAYAYPEPPGFAAEPVAPAEAFYKKEMGEFLLPYDDVRNANDPDAALMAFLQSTYEAAANRGTWDRPALER
jgi:hypothetical protein